jgi:hypothetical protein
MPAHTPRSPSTPAAEDLPGGLTVGPSASTTTAFDRARRRAARWSRSHFLRVRHTSLLVVVAALLVTVVGVVAGASAAPLSTAGRLALGQPPVLPIPPNPSCAPGSADPLCLLPSTAPRPPASASPLPPITALPTPVPSCFPGSVLPGCGPFGGPAPATSTAPPVCDGPNCIPAPSTLDPGAPTLAPLPGGTGGADDPECGITNISGCLSGALTGFFRGLVADALNPLLDLLGRTLLTTPEPDVLPSVGQLWTESWHILLAVYVILVLVAAMILMAHQTLQTRYTVKEIAPRLVVGFLAGTLSLFVATKGIQIANALAQAVLGEGVDPVSAGDALTAMVQNSLNGGGAFLIFIGLALAVMIIVLLITFIVRVMLTILLIAAAPIALMWHALPHTDGIAQAWWKAYGGAMAIQVGQSLALVVALKVFFAPGGFTVFGPTMSGLINLLMCLALIYVLIKIPFWCLSPMRSGGRSLIGSLMRGAIAYKTMGLLGGIGAATGGGKRGGKQRGGAESAPPVDPPATRSGQYMLPMKVRRSAKPFRAPRRGWDERPRPDLSGGNPGPGQLSLFTASGHGADRGVGPNPRALPLAELPNALPNDQLGLPITVRRDPDRTSRRTLADDLAAGRPAPLPVRQAGLLRPDGRINRQARPPAHVPRAMLAPSTGMFPLHLPPQTPRPPRHTLADQLADPARTTRAPQTGPGLITPSGQINRAARAHRRPAREAYTGNRPLASGQYPLPLGVQRQPKPAEPPTPRTPAASPKRTGIQVPLPLDLPARPRRPKKK